MDDAELLRQYGKLPPKTRLILAVSCARPELSLKDVAAQVGSAVSTLRSRLKVAYRQLECEGRVDLQARLGPLLERLHAEAPQP